MRNGSDDRSSTASRIPLNTLAIPFGVLGWSGCWSATAAAFGWPRASVEPIWVIGIVVFLWVIGAHTYRGHRAGDPLVSQLRHPAQGPLAAIAPVIVMLIGAHLYPIAPVAGAVLVYAGIVIGAGFAAWLIAFWIQHPIPIASLHGGYFLPTVAAGFIAAETSAVVGNPTVAMASFGVGMLFWVVIFTLVLARLAFVDPLPDALMPTIAILAAPPAVGGTAWLMMNGQRIDGLSVAFLGGTILMMLLQLALVPAYRRLTFTLGFWSFTFSMSAVAGQVIILSGIARYPGWQIVVVTALAAISILIVSIAVRSLATALRQGARLEERQLATADRAVEDAPGGPGRA